MAFASLTALAQHALSYSPQIRTKPKQMRDPQVNNPPVAEYVLQRLAVRSKKIARNDCIIPVLLSVPTHPSQQDLGIKKCFGVPGKAHIDKDISIIVFNGCTYFLLTATQSISTLKGNTCFSLLSNDSLNTAHKFYRRLCLLNK